MVVGRGRLTFGIRTVGIKMKNKKSLGQHWLKNRVILDEIADLAAGNGAEGSASVSSEKPELVVEIGPGLGTLTGSLLKRFNRVIAVEYDKNLAENLPKSFPGKNLEVINADILDCDFDDLPQPYSVAGNIPYYITSPIIEKLLKVENKPERIVLLIQKEVAERIAGDKETMLSLFVKNYVNVELGPVVGRAEFTPPPKVDSQVIVLRPHAPVVKEEVFGLVRQGFSAPRKKLIHNLAGLKSKEELTFIFAKLGVDIDARPGDLYLSDWQKMYDEISK